MTVRVTLTFVRPDTDTEWYELSTEQYAYMKTNYNDAGKRLAISVTGSDGLTQERVTTYTDDGRSEYDDDSTIQTMVTSILDHATANSITFNKVVETL